MTVPERVWNAFWADVVPDNNEKALERVIAELLRTPLSFSWTPAMCAIWPDGYRPTMSGLLAIWEAMREAAEYEPLGCQAAAEPVADADGWIAHRAGDPMPCEVDTLVQYRMGGSRYSTDMVVKAGKLDWGVIRGAHDCEITHWRPAK